MMNLQAPLHFRPLFMERVWGSDRLASLYNKPLPSGERIGESWEIVDRPEAQSVVAKGPLEGVTLNDLWMHHREAIFGARYADAGERFPLLFKWLDAAERLSVQVHPPAAIAPEMGGEPKTEMWYIAAATPDADIFAGLKAGVAREAFAAALEAGTVETLLHRLPTQEGDCIFIPSGRVHAIGAGNVIVEVQQNSDTTYRVFDWNRVGLDGKPRDLHIEESLRSIDFNDPEPQFQPRDASPTVESPFFRVDRWALDAPRPAADPGDFSILTVLKGKVAIGEVAYHPGDFLLIPATLAERTAHPLEEGTVVLQTTLPA